MKRIDLINNIEGSKLKKQFLEAFLLQSAFIEGLLKKLLENDFSANISTPLMIDNYKKHKEDFSSFSESKQIIYIKEKLMRQNLYEIIDYLHRMDKISTSLKKQLNNYREKRNGILHDLVGNMSRNEFEKEIEELVKLGQDILEDPIMVIASESVQQSEEIRELLDSGDQIKLNEYFEKITKH